MISPSPPFFSTSASFLITGRIKGDFKLEPSFFLSCEKRKEKERKEEEKEEEGG